MKLLHSRRGGLQGTAPWVRRVGDEGALAGDSGLRSFDC
jgi:hypothetical protein